MGVAALYNGVIGQNPMNSGFFIVAAALCLPFLYCRLIKLEDKQFAGYVAQFAEMDDDRFLSMRAEIENLPLGKQSQLIKEAYRSEYHRRFVEP